MIETKIQPVAKLDRIKDDTKDDVGYRDFLEFFRYIRGTKNTRRIMITN